MTRPAPTRVLKGLLAAGLVFVLLEGVASLAFFVWSVRMSYWRPLPERSHTVYDPELGWASRKGSVARDVFGPGLDVSTNARGFRNASEFQASVAPDKTRVVALGDSFTLGYGVGDADSWPASLERLCPRLEVPNMGQSGYGIDQSYLWYLRDGRVIDQDVLVLAFIDDDLLRVRHDDMLGYGKPVLRLIDGELVATNVPVPRAPYLLPVLTQNLALLERLRLVELPRALVARFAPRPVPGETMSEAEAQQVDEAIFRALARDAAERDARLLLVHLPHLAQGRPDRIAELPALGVAALERVRQQAVVGVMEHEQLAGRPREPGVSRQARAEVRLSDQLHAGRARGDLRRVVRRSVVDDDHLLGRTRLSANALERLAQEASAVVAGYDDGDPHELPRPPLSEPGSRHSSQGASPEANRSSSLCWSLKVSMQVQKPGCS